MVSRNYRIKIVVDGKEFEAEGDKTFVLDMMKKFSPETAVENKTKHIDKTQSKTTTEFVAGKNMSVREFIQQFQFKKHTDITLAFGYYLEKHNNLVQFSPADINRCYYDAKMESSNTSQMIVQNIKRAFIMEAKKNREEKGSKRYVLTDTGEKYIETKMPHNS